MKKQELRKKILKTIFVAAVNAALKSASKNGGPTTSKEGEPLMEKLSKKQKEDLLSIVKFFDDIINTKGFKKYKIHIDENKEDIIVRVFVRHKKK